MRYFVLTASILLLLARGARADDTTRHPPIEFFGYFKSMPALTDVRDNYRRLGLIDRDCALDDYERLRLKSRYAPRDWIDLTVHYEAYSIWGDAVTIRRRLQDSGASSLFSETLPSGGTIRPRYLDMEGDIVDERTFILRHGLDRLQLRLRTESAELSLGRQAVSWGTGLLWNPTDLFTAFSPTEIDREEKAGVDVARLLWTPTPDSSIDVVAEPLDTNKTYGLKGEDSSWAVRTVTHVGEYEIAGCGGFVAGDWVAGGDFTGYLGDAGFRGEGLYTFVKETDQRDYFRGLLSVDYSFHAPGDPYAAAEYFFNGLGENDPDNYFSRLRDSSVQRVFERGTAYNIGGHYLGILLRVAPSTLLTIQNQAIVNLTDGSVSEYPLLSRSLSQNVDLLIGAVLGLGGLGTEFGGWSQDQAGTDFGNPDLYFTYLKIYF